MFNNVGAKIKGVISVVSGIMMLISIIIGIAVFIISRWELGGFWAFVVGVAVAGIGILISWLSNLVGYAFGQLVENSDRIREMLEDDEDGEEVIAKIVTPSVAKSAQSNSLVKAPSNIYNENTTYVTCPNCNESQPAGKSYCNICGAKMNANVPISTPAKPLEAVGNAKKTSDESKELVICPKCGELQPRGMNYCQVCGGKIPYVLN